MGKYGNGVSMRTVILAELEEIKKAINRSDIANEDAKIIKDAFLEMAYQWCSSNAAFCAFDAMLRADYEKDWNEMMHSFLHNRVYNETYMQKMRATWPF